MIKFGARIPDENNCMSYLHNSAVKNEYEYFN